MKIQKTISVILGTLLTAVIAWSSSYYCSYTQKCYKLVDFGARTQYAIEMVVAIVVALVFCAVAWLMLVWDAGDKIPPAVMLLLGLLGVSVYLIYLFADFKFHSPSWFPSFYASTARMVSALFIAFGVAGFFTKKKPN